MHELNEADVRVKPRSSAELVIRTDLAACYRLLAQLSMSDTIYTHVTARVGEEGRAILINPYGLLFEEITASSLMKVGLDGVLLEQSPFPVNAAGFVVHSAIYAGRPDVNCIIHTHTTAGIAVSALERGLLPISQSAMQFYKRIGYHPYEGLATDHEESVRLLHNLGENRAMILRNHGLLVAESSIPAALETMYYLEQACRTQLEAQRCGEELHMPPPDVCEHTARQYETPGTMPRGLRLWSALRRRLDAEDTSYRD